MDFNQAGDFSASELVTSGDMNVTFGNNNNVYVPPFPVSDKPTTTMASQQEQLAASLANQPVPTPGKTPASTPSQGAVSRKTAVITTTSTTAAKTTPPKTKKKKTKTGPAQEEVVTITKKHLTELLKLPEQMKSLQQRVTNAERALKRKTSSSNPDDSAKKQKVGPSSLIESLRNTPRFVNPAYFHNWWNKRGVVTLTKKRMLGELTNMGLSEDTLAKLSLHFLAEVYCLVISLLLESGAIQSLPSDVPNCYGVTAHEPAPVTKVILYVCDPKHYIIRI